MSERGAIAFGIFCFLLAAMLTTLGGVSKAPTSCLKACAPRVVAEVSFFACRCEASR